MAEAKKERKLSAKQAQIVNAMKNATAINGPGSSYKPAQVAVECGKTGGSPGSDWAYPAIKTLVRKGILEKDPEKAGRYRVAAPKAPAE